ncbi:hypothetical protein ACIBQ1_37260 [Nonomuraea sp. NPDC050153]|uniref:hypothetical protein n=1 Tax=Nonomuraea sp. NPDC050153 TaxID=3364359 RepID=UPI0037B648A7
MDGGKVLTGPGCVVVPTSAVVLSAGPQAADVRSSVTLVRGTLGHAIVVLTADIYVPVLPQL